MAKSHYVYSTLSNATSYGVWSEGGSDLPRLEHHITINGKAGIADKYLMTPRGAVTKVTDQELKMLEENPVFQLHMKNGFITVEGAADIDAVVANMQGREPAAPLVPGDYKDVSIEQTRTGSDIGAPETTPGGKGGATAKK